MPALSVLTVLAAALPAALILAPCAAGAQGATADRTAPPGAVVDAAWLAPRLADPALVVLHVDHQGDYAGGHLPGARVVDYGRLVTRRGTLSSELPDLDAARTAFEALGVSDGSTVVVYAHEAPMAMRTLFTLAVLGVERIAYLDGGLEAWRTAGHPVSRETPPVTPGRLTARPPAPLIATADWILPRLGTRGLALIDTRTDGEYLGTGNRSGMPSAGHLAGARQLEWQHLFRDGRATLKPRAELEALFRERAAPGDTVVTYCWVGYRASATWFVARWLGYDARMYDGSYQDWSQRQLPTRGGAAP